jgi:hypothetical protein
MIWFKLSVAVTCLLHTGSKSLRSFELVKKPIPSLGPGELITDDALEGWPNNGVINWKL